VRVSLPTFFNASHAARCVACHGVRSHAVRVALGALQREFYTEAGGEG
jgi:hypothetical protein